MDTDIKMITPKDVFVSILHTGELPYMDKQEVVENTRPSGNQFMDKLTEKVSRNLLAPLNYYEYWMGLKGGALTQMVMMFSGMSFKDWRNQYILLAAQELLSKTDYSHTTIGKRLGFSGNQAFGLWFKQMVKCTPGVWRVKIKAEEASEYNEALLHFKQEYYRTKQQINETKG